MFEHGEEDGFLVFTHQQCNCVDVPKRWSRPNSTTTDDIRELWIRSKYEFRKFVKSKREMEETFSFFDFIGFD